MNIEIREAVKSDLPKVLRIQKKAFTFQANKYNDFTIPPMVETVEDLENVMKHNIIFVALLDNEIVGSIRIDRQGEEAEIKRLSVSDDKQGNGIGVMLMNVAEMQFPNVKRFWLFTGKESYRSINLYRRLGYELYKEEAHKHYQLVYLQKLM